VKHSSTAELDVLKHSVHCRPGSGGGHVPGPINVVVGGGAGASAATGAAHLQRLSPLRSDTEFSRYVSVAGRACRILCQTRAVQSFEL